ncbi:DUF4230 domain-containing protein [Echinicola sp. 20G]|uniref:DUF4230 domain-containing protein n=1 Tax=Echinicola sp. 20G TaxID=2781961 RepID=UPI0019103390|nr:DUF4230 domain-containing protein [Echinicola sp. 20G]
MIGLLFKNWRFIIDILLVIGVVILLFWWNPMGIFGGGLKLEDTANMVTEVNKIGELVTAEYYGEVITSIDEARLNPIKSEDIKEEIGILQLDLLAALTNLTNYQKRPVDHRVEEYRESEKINNWRRIIKHEVDSRNIMEKLAYLGYLDEIAADPLYDDLMEFLWRQEFEPATDKEPKTRDLEKTMFQLYNGLDNQQPFNEELKVAFISNYHSNLNENLSRKESRKRLTMIGRGWVKAGFDFGELGPESVVYYEDRGIVHIIGLTPKILNADINPWFIPEKGIPGFQILDEKGQVNFHDAKRVKQYCIDKLTMYAYQAQILENARKQGEETLKNLFSLLTGQEIKQVVFHNNPFIEFAKEAEEDEWISYSEAYLFDSLLRMEIKKIDSLKNTVQNQSINRGFAEENEKIIVQILERFQQYPYQDGKAKFNYFSLQKSQIAEDSLIDKKEIELLQNMRVGLSFGSEISQIQYANVFDTLTGYWFDHPLKYAKSYNEMLHALIEMDLGLTDVETATLAKTEFNLLIVKDSIRVSHYEYLDPNEEKVLLSYFSKNFSDSLYTNWLYPIALNLDSLYAFKEMDKPFEDSLSIASENVLPKRTTGFWYFDSSLNPTEAFAVNLNPESLLPKPLLLKFETTPYLYHSEFGFLGKGNFNLTVSADALSNKRILNEQQTKELSGFLSLMIQVRMAEDSKSLLDKTTDWVNSRTKDRKGAQVYFTKRGFQVK